MWNYSVTKTEKPLKTSLVWIQVFLSQWASTFVWSTENSVKFWHSNCCQCVLVTASEQSTWEWWFSCISLFESFKEKWNSIIWVSLIYLVLTCIFRCNFSYSKSYMHGFENFIDNFAGSIFIEKKLGLKSSILVA